MPEGLASLAGRGAPWLLTYLLHSSALILVAWTLDRGGVVRRARSLDALWKAALIGGLVTATVTVTRARGPGGTAITRVQAVVHREVTDPARAELAWATPRGGSHVRASLGAPSAECRALVRQASGGEAWLRALREACAPVRPDWRTALVLAWAIGAAGLLALAVRDRRGLVAAMADGRPAGERVLAIAATLTRPGRAVPPIRISAAVPAPCAFGGRVILPARCEAEMSDGELAAVLAHELAHLERRDPAWLAVADLVRRVAWIQPLNRLALAGVRDAAELVTDLRALRAARAIDLARSLHRVAAWALPATPAARVTGLVRSRDGSLTRRMRRILSPAAERGAGSPWPGALLAIGLTTGALLLPPVAVTRVLQAVVVQRVERAAELATPGTEDVTTLVDDAPGETRVVVRVLRDAAGPLAPPASPDSRE